MISRVQYKDYLIFDLQQERITETREPSLLAVCLLLVSVGVSVTQIQDLSLAAQPLLPTIFQRRTGVFTKDFYGNLLNVNSKNLKTILHHLKQFLVEIIDQEKNRSGLSIELVTTILDQKSKCQPVIESTLTSV